MRRLRRRLTGGERLMLTAGAGWFGAVALFAVLPVFDPVAFVVGWTFLTVMLHDLLWSKRLPD